MNNILAFDSIFIVNPLRLIYIAIVRNLLCKNIANCKRIILYRLDKHNLLLRHDRNISGMAHGIHKDELEELSLQFYQHLKENKFCSHIKYKNIKLLDLYTRQVKLKLIEVIKTVYRLEKSSKTSKCNFEVISDAQTIDIIRVAIKFLDVDLSTISFKSNNSLTLLVSLNAFLMRSISFSNDYYAKHPSTGLFL